MTTNEIRTVFHVFLICSRWKIKWILFKTTYPNINMIVLCIVYCVFIVAGLKTHSLYQVSWNIFLKTCPPPHLAVLDNRQFQAHKQNWQDRKNYQSMHAYSYFQILAIKNFLFFLDFPIILYCIALILLKIFHAFFVIYNFMYSSWFLFVTVQEITNTAFCYLAPHC